MTFFSRFNVNLIECLPTNSWILTLCFPEEFEEALLRVEAELLSDGVTLPCKIEQYCNYHNVFSLVLPVSSANSWRKYIQLKK